MRRRIKKEPGYRRTAGPHGNRGWIKSRGVADDEGEGESSGGAESVFVPAKRKAFGIRNSSAE